MFTTLLFYLLAVVLVVAAFRVITATSPVTAVLHLILAFFTASMIWMLQHAEFLALMLILVYVGAVMVMFLFVVMMLDMRDYDHTITQKLKPYVPLGIIIGLIMVLEMAVVLTRSWFETPQASKFPADYDNTLELGILMYQQYPFAVQVGGVVLLVGMVSAIALTLRKREDARYTRSGEQVRVRAQDRVRLVDMPSQSEKTTPSENTKGDA